MKYFRVVLLAIFLPLPQLFAQWSPVGTGIYGKSLFNNGPQVNALCVYKGNLYAGGSFDSAGGIPASDVAQWNGTTWAAVDSGINVSWRYTVGVNVMLTDSANNALYVGGQWDTAGGVSHTFDIASWNGTHWGRLQNGLSGYAVGFGVHALAMYKDSLYAGGSLVITGNGLDSIHNIGCWNMSNWSQPDKGTYPGHIYALCVYQGNLCAAGDFQKAGGNPANCLAMWNGITWTVINTGFQLYYSYVYALAVYNGNLVVAGQFDSAGGLWAGGIAAWNGSSWSTLGTGVNTKVAKSINALAVINGKLVVGGAFDSINGIKANNIAVYDGTHWSTLGTGVDSTVNALVEYNGKLYAGGMFDSAGGNLARGIAEWNGPLSVSEASVPANNFIIYPNPGTGIFIIKQNEYKQDGRIEVYNLLGEKISECVLSRTQTRIDLTNQSNAVYFYRIVSSEGEPITSGRIIKE